MDACLRVAQIVAQVLGEGFESGFGGVVGHVAGRVGDALLRAGYDDGGCGGAGADEGEEGGDAVDGAEEVGVHYLGSPVLERRDFRLGGSLTLWK